MSPDPALAVDAATDPTSPVRDILFVELLGGFGDLLIALPAITALARHYPEASLTVVTFAPGAELLAKHPGVDHVIPVVDHAEGAPADALRAALAGGGRSGSGPDLAVTTTCYGGIPELIESASRRAVTDLWRGAPSSELVGTRFLEVLCEERILPRRAIQTRLEVVLDAGERRKGRNTLIELTRPTRPTRPTHPNHPTHPTQATLPARAASLPPVVCVPDSGMAIKTWPDFRWHSLVKRLAAAKRPVLFTDCPPALAELVRGEGARMIPRTSLRDLAAVFAAVADAGGVVVGVDTGPVRLAASVGARTVCLFGPTPASRYGIVTGVDRQGLPDCALRRPRAITEQECWWSAKCPYQPDGAACMSAIDAAGVMELVLETEKREPPAKRAAH